MSNPLEPLLNEIIARLERGVPPWRQPWANGADPSTPLRSDGQPFSGSNAWLLAFAGAERGDTSPFWFTFRQALAIGAPVAKGARSALAILYKTRVVDGRDIVRRGRGWGHVGSGNAFWRDCRGCPADADAGGGGRERSRDCRDGSGITGLYCRPRPCCYRGRGRLCGLGCSGGL